MLYEWIDIKHHERYPEENKGVLIFVKYDNNLFNIFTGHQQQKIWYAYDHFTKGIREIENQDQVTHWRAMPELPTPPVIQIPGRCRL